MSRVLIGDRGLGEYERFKDTQGRRVRVQDSSAADSPCVWVFVSDWGDPEVHGMHLDVKAAKRLRDALSEFIGRAEP